MPDFAAPEPTPMPYGGTLILDGPEGQKDGLLVHFQNGHLVIGFRALRSHDFYQLFLTDAGDVLQ